MRKDVTRCVKMCIACLAWNQLGVDVKVVAVFKLRGLESNRVQNQKVAERTEKTSKGS